MRRDDLSFRSAFSWKWLLILTFGESRKSGFALWLAAIATFLLLIKPIAHILAAIFRATAPMIESAIDGQMWFLCVSISAGLFGFGTVADKKLEIKKIEAEKKPDDPAPAS
jgi:hypothetical protein